MATISGTIPAAPRIRPAASNERPAIPIVVSWRRAPSSAAAERRRKRMAAVVAASPEQIWEKVADSVKAAEEKCAEDPKSGECIAAWDEVEELSAAASHARDRRKEHSDPLEEYCKDNPGTGQCRTYDD